MTDSLLLISHHLCPYVQRASIALTEKNVPFDRVYVDLANKPDWFLAISPLGKTPVLKAGDSAIFESAVILEFLEETQAPALHPREPVRRAEHRAWIEFGSAILNDIAGFYNASDAEAFEGKTHALSHKFKRLERQLDCGPYFAGDKFSLVDTAFGPVFRYFDVFDEIGRFGILDDKPGVRAWRRALAERPSIQAAVSDDYAARLWRFLQARRSHLTALMAADLSLRPLTFVEAPAISV